MRARPRPRPLPRLRSLRRAFRTTKASTQWYLMAGLFGGLTLVTAPREPGSPWVIVGMGLALAMVGLGLVNWFVERIVDNQLKMVEVLQRLAGAGREDPKGWARRHRLQ